MSLSIAGTKSALGPGLTASFLASGGTAPYVYSIRNGGAGGSINAGSGLYTAPSVVPSDPQLLFDTIQVKDNVGAIATVKIMVGNPLLLLTEILWRELGLAPERVVLWDQKAFQPSDAGLYIAVSVPNVKPFASVSKPAIIDGVPDWSQQFQVLNVMATCDLDIISRDNSALFRKEEVLLAINSLYSEAQQEANSFSIGRLSPGSRFTNLSVIDGAAIPYRYRISVNMQYAVTKQKPADYFDTFQTVAVTVDNS